MEIRQSKNAFIVGVFIVIALAIFTLMVFTLGGERKTFSRKIPLKVVFTDINGLKEGNNIWFSGVKVGTVKAIDLKGISDVEVTLSVEKKTLPYIHKDATAKISSDGLLGNKIVIIYGGTSTLPAIEANDYLAVAKSSPNDDIMASLQVTGKNLLDISANIKDISKKINEGEGTLGKLINDPALLNTLQASLENFKTVTAKSKHVVNDMEAFTSRMNTEGSSINKIFTDSLLYDSIQAIIAQVKQVTVTANSFSKNIETLTENIKNASSTLKDTTNTAGMILNDPGLAQQLQAIITNLESASKKLDEDLEAIQHNFLFRGYFRKKEKQ